MDRKKNMDLIVISLIFVASVITTFILPDGNPLRFIMALPLLFFVPGYMLVCVLWPSEEQLPIIERIMLSTPLSLMLDVGIGLLLSFFAWISLLTLMIIHSTIVLAMITMTVGLRKRYDPGGEKEHINIEEDNEKGRPVKTDLWKKLPVLALVFAVAAAGAAVLPYYMEAHDMQKGYSTVFFTDENGTMDNLPGVVALYHNQSVTIKVWVECHEEAITLYGIDLWFSNDTWNANESTNITLIHREFELKPGEKMQINYTIEPVEIENLIGENTGNISGLSGEYRLGAALDAGNDGKTDNSAWIRVEIG